MFALTPGRFRVPSCATPVQGTVGIIAGFPSTGGLPVPL
jgi:hypothetical protein